MGLHQESDMTEKLRTAQPKGRGSEGSSPGGASCTEPICQCKRHIKDVGSILGLGRSPRGMAIHSVIATWRISMDRERSLAGHRIYGPKESGIVKAFETREGRRRKRECSGKC